MATLVISLSGGQNNASILGSLGGQRSDTTITSDVIENFLDNITRTEALLGKTEFRCGYIYNPGAGTETGIVLELAAHPALTNIAIGLDPAGKGDGRTNGIATSISTESAVPSGVKFFGIESDGNWNKIILPIGFLKQGESVPFWIKRITETGPATEITFNLITSHNQNETSGNEVEDGGAIGEILKFDVVPSGGYVIGTARVGLSDLG